MGYRVQSRLGCRTKRICAWPNATEVNIYSQTSDVIMHFRHSGHSQDLVARVSEQTDIVRPFFAPNRKIKGQVLRASRNLQRCLNNVSLALPASHRSFTKIQDGCISRFRGVSGSHPYAIRPSRRLAPAKVDAFLNFCSEICQESESSAAAFRPPNNGLSKSKTSQYSNLNRPRKPKAHSL
jgi:hypothetical protein